MTNIMGITGSQIAASGMTKSRRLGIDARFYGIAGPGRYVSNLLKNLEGKVDFEVYVFLTSKGFGEYAPQNQHFHKVLCNVSWYSWLEQIILPFFFLRYHLDLLHVPHFNFPIFYPGKIILTIHDLIINEFSTERATTRFPWYYRFKRLVYQIVMWWGIRRATKIIVPSQYVKNRLLEVYKCSGEKIVVTYEGVGIGRSKGTACCAPTAVKYFLYVGSMYPHKNLERLIRAFKELKSSGNFLGQLVLIGKWDYFSQRLQSELGSSEIIFPAEKSLSGYLSDEEIKPYYEQAVAFVFPSLSEGFGLPPLEAMSLGCPVVASSAASIPEICGEAALYFNPKNEEDMEEKLERIISDEDLRQDLINKGLENIKRFSWEKMAKETLKVYESCFSS